MQAKYTMYLRDIMKSEQGMNILNQALSTYPLYQSATTIDIIPSREELNKRLLNHHKNKEIGFETLGRFVDELEIVMCEIMPYYNELYKSVEIMVNIPNPFDNVDIVETYSETRTATSSNELSTTSSMSGESDSDTTSKHIGNDETNTSGTTNESSSTNSTLTGTKNGKTVKSGTPQDDLSITGANINSVSYADEVQWNNENNNDTTSGTGESESTQSSKVTSTNTVNGESSTNSSSTSNGTSETTGSATSTDTIEHTFTKKGNQGVNTYAHDMNEFRTSIIDVTNQIINDSRIAELFMMVF